MSPSRSLHAPGRSEGGWLGRPIVQRDLSVARSTEAEEFVSRSWAMYCNLEKKSVASDISGPKKGKEM